MLVIYFDTVFLWPQCIYPVAYISYFLVHKCSVHKHYKYTLWYGHGRISEPLQSNTVVNQPTEWDTKSLHALSYRELVDRECEKTTTLGNDYNCNFCWETWESSHSSTKLWKLSTPEQLMTLCKPIQVPLGPKARSHFTAVWTVTAP